VKRIRDSSLPAGAREWLSDSDFEYTMDDLRAQAGPDVFVPGQGVDVDLVLLRAYQVSPDFVGLPQGILGRTTFYPDGRVHVEVARELADEAEGSATARRRLRSTLGHECGHIAFHRHHFLVTDRQQPLFGSAPKAEPQVLCRGESIDDRVRKRDGREYQANRGMASLLLPQPLVRDYVRAALERAGVETLRDAARDGRAEQMLRELCDAFDVSLQMALYRVQDLKLLPRETAQSDFGW
jgi:hypothetical protein